MAWELQIWVHLEDEPWGWSWSSSARRHYVWGCHLTLLWLMELHSKKISNISSLSVISIERKHTDMLMCSSAWPGELEILHRHWKRCSPLLILPIGPAHTLACECYSQKGMHPQRDTVLISPKPHTGYEVALLIFQMKTTEEHRGKVSCPNFPSCQTWLAVGPPELWINSEILLIYMHMCV